MKTELRTTKMYEIYMSQRMYKLNKTKNEDIQKGLSIYSLNERAGVYREKWLTHLNRMDLPNLHFSTNPKEYKDGGCECGLESV